MIKSLLIISLISLALVFIWFKDGYIMGTAEAVLPFYDLEKYYHLTEYAWTFHPGLGNITGATVAGKPFYFFLAFLQNIGIAGFVLQASVFFTVLLTAGIGSYLLIKELFPKLSDRYYLYSSLIYLFNPISLVNIWNRFLLNFMIFYAFLPVGVLIFLKGIREKKYLYSLVFSLIVSVYSYSFSSMAFIILLWIILAILTLFYLITAPNFKEKIFCVKYFVLTFIIFLITNSWYLSQLLNYATPANFQSDIRTFHPQNVNISTLDSLSKRMGDLSYLYTLSNSSFLDDSELSWVAMYKTLPVIILGFITTGIVLFGILKGRKEKSVLLLGFVFFTALFLSKGSNPPFGFLFKWAFEFISPLQAFRNPIEKFSFLLVLVFAPLLSLGLFYLSKIISQKIVLTLLIIFIFIYAFPLLSGMVFSSKTPPNNDPNIGFKVEVPEYYKEANNYLNSRGDNFRVLGFPVADEGITYDWGKGYQGADLPSTLFDNPVIFFNTSVPYYYDLVKEIEPALLDTKGFTSIAGFLNARYFLIRGDVDVKARKLTDPKIIEKNLIEREGSGEIIKVGDFGKIKVWENKNWKDMTFYAANKVIATPSAALHHLGDLSSDEVLIEGRGFESESGELPKISYQKINPALYKVKVENSTSPFMLIFLETFNTNWYASYKDKEIKNHFRANVYANGWLVDKTGNFEIDIIFLPQKLLEITEKISLGSIILICIIIFIKRKSFVKK